MKINLSSEWHHTLSDYDWESGSMNSLYKYMDLKLEVLFPPLKRIINILTSLKKSPQETHVQYMERVKNAMMTGGVRSRAAFSLAWDKLIIVLVLKGLTNNDQCNILKRLIH